MRRASSLDPDLMRRRPERSREPEALREAYLAFWRRSVGAG
jgi:hypothetical protein